MNNNTPASDHGLAIAGLVRRPRAAFGLTAGAAVCRQTVMRQIARGFVMRSASFILLIVLISGMTSAIAQENRHRFGVSAGRNALVWGSDANGWGGAAEAGVNYEHIFSKHISLGTQVEYFQMRNPNRLFELSSTAASARLSISLNRFANLTVLADISIGLSHLNYRATVDFWNANDRTALLVEPGIRLEGRLSKNWYWESTIGLRRYSGDLWTFEDNEEATFSPRPTGINREISFGVAQYKVGLKYGF